MYCPYNNGMHLINKHLCFLESVRLLKLFFYSFRDHLQHKRNLIYRWQNIPGLSSGIREKADQFIS